MKMKPLLFSFMLIGLPTVAEPAEEFPIREIVRYPTKEEMRTDFLNKLIF